MSLFIVYNDFQASANPDRIKSESVVCTLYTHTETHTEAHVCTHSVQSPWGPLGRWTSPDSSAYTHFTMHCDMCYIRHTHRNTQAHTCTITQMQCCGSVLRNMEPAIMTSLPTADWILWSLLSCCDMSVTCPRSGSVSSKWRIQQDSLLCSWDV